MFNWLREHGAYKMHATDEKGGSPIKITSLNLYCQIPPPAHSPKHNRVPSSHVRMFGSFWQNKRKKYIYFNTHNATRLFSSDSCGSLHLQLASVSLKLQIVLIVLVSWEKTWTHQGDLLGGTMVNLILKVRMRNGNRRIGDRGFKLKLWLFPW